MLLDARLYYPAINEIIQTGNWMTNQVGIELKEFGITEPQFNVLRILKSQNGAPMMVSSILNRMVQRTSNVTRIVDKLNEKGLVTRKECPTNRRKMDIHITEQGSNLLMELNRKMHTFHLPLMKNLEPEEAKTLTELLKKLKKPSSSTSTR
ncbi:MAG: MarR family transcriptional regulator [Cytophagales bacterium]|nr:MarR family transcriptional regulator [Cytophagales bacterium]